jgi:hypothetical protein
LDIRSHGFSQLKTSPFRGDEIAIMRKAKCLLPIGGDFYVCRFGGDPHKWCGIHRDGDRVLQMGACFLLLTITINQMLSCFDLIPVSEQDVPFCFHLGFVLCPLGPKFGMRLGNRTGCLLHHQAVLAITWNCISSDSFPTAIPACERLNRSDPYKSLGEANKWKK